MEGEAHLWIQLVGASDGFFDSTIFDRFADLHPFLDGDMIDIMR